MIWKKTKMISSLTISHKNNYTFHYVTAEGERFELSVEQALHWFSRPAYSTTLAPLQVKKSSLQYKSFDFTSSQPQMFTRFEFSLEKSYANVTKARLKINIKGGRHEYEIAWKKREEKESSEMLRSW